MSAVWVITECEFCDTEVVGVADGLQVAQRVAVDRAGGPLRWMEIDDVTWAGTRADGGSTFYVTAVEVERG